MWLVDTYVKPTAKPTANRSQTTLVRFAVDSPWSPRQIHGKSTTSRQVDMLWICRRAVDLPWICRGLKRFAVDSPWARLWTRAHGKPTANRASGVWVLGAGSSSVATVSPTEAHVRGALPKMGPDDDNVIGFFSAFERCLELYGVEKSAYSRLLPGCLSPKAAKVYSNLNREQALDYELTKKQILASFKLDALSYLAKFRSAKRSGSESYTLFANRLQDLLNYYLDAKCITTFESLKSDLLLNAFVETLPIAVKSLVLAKRAKDIFEAADQADLAFQIEQERSRGNAQRNFPIHDKSSSQWSKLNSATEFRNSDSQKEMPKTFPSGDHTSITCFSCGKTGHKKSACTDTAKNSKTGAGNLKVPTCFSCGERGHKSGSPQCKKAQASRNNQNLWVHDDANHSMQAFIIPCYVNGVQTQALRDSGAEINLICAETFKDVVTPIPGKYVRISGITGKSEQIPVAEIDLFSPHFKHDREVKVMAGLVTNKNLREKVILGNRLFQLHPELVDILSVHQEIDRSVGMEQIHMVTTRSKSRTIVLNEHSSKRENNLQNGSVVQKQSSEQSAQQCAQVVTAGV
jgi:hypothetical protein